MSSSEGLAVPVVTSELGEVPLEVVVVLVLPLSDPDELPLPAVVDVSG